MSSAARWISFSRLGATPQLVCEFDNIENIKKAVEIDGVALLPEPSLRPEVEAGTLVALPLIGARFVRPLGIIQSRHHKLSTSARRFLDLLRQPEDAPDTTSPGDAHATNGHARRSGPARTSTRNV